MPSSKITPASAFPRKSTAGQARILSRVAVALLGLALVACSRDEPPAPAVDVVAAAPPAEAKPAEVPVPEGEPPADVVRDLMFEEYAELEKAGPMPATVSASGRQLQLRAKLFDARKTECRPRPQRPAVEFECSLTILVSMTGDGSDPAQEEPSEQGARIGIKWDPSGKWVRG